MDDRPTLSQMFTVFGRIGLISFGGPAAQISLMHGELVERHRWLSEDQFLKALSFCMLLPGPEAMQLATYAGWRLRGVVGGLLAGLLFVLPGAAVIFALAFGYVAYGNLPVIHAVFAGVQATVVVVVLQALWRLSQKALKGRASWLIAAAAFIALFFFSAPFPLIIALAALIGALRGAHENPGPDTDPGPRSTGRGAQTIRTVAIWATLWLTPVALLWAFDQTFLIQIALFFSQLAVVTFGGAYAVLAYMTQAVVETHGWLTTPQMIDALGLAETTPGPLILVTQFAGVIAGHSQGGLWMALGTGMLVLWVTFCPCFLWIFAGAPYVETLLARPRLKAALDAISTAVVGVILNLSIWFALHVIFGNVSAGQFGPSVALGSISLTNLALILSAAVLLLALRCPLLVVLTAMGLIGAATLPLAEFLV